MTATTTVTNALPLPSVYQAQWRANRDASWQTGLDLSLGFTFDSNQVPQPVIQLMAQDVTEYAALTVDSNRCLIVTIDLTSVRTIVCTPTTQTYVQCTATFSADGETFAGYITDLCAGKVQYDWQGRCETLSVAWRAAMNHWLKLAMM